MSVTLSLFAGAGAQFFDNNGNVLSGGKIYTYQAGTTTPLATYTSNSESAFHTNPIILDAAGRVPSGGEIWLQLGIGYKFILKTSTDVLIATYDNIPSSAQPPAANDADSIMYEQGYTVTAGSFIAGKIYRIASVGTTNFTLIGSVNNTVGTHFIATGAGSGTGTAELSQTVENKLRETVSVKDFGAVGDGVTDDTVAIQAAITSVTAAGGEVYFPIGTYNISAPLRVSSSTSLIGANTAKSIIRKTTNTVGTGTSLARGGTVIDTYAVDAIIQLIAPDNEYTIYTQIRNLQLIKSSFAASSYGIYVPRANHFVFQSVWIINCATGYYTFDSWMSSLNDVTVQACNTGFQHANDGTGNGTGTSINFYNCWINFDNTVAQPSVGYNFFGLTYSSLNGCAADNFIRTDTDSARAYLFNTCIGMAMNGCGCENGRGSAIANFGSPLVVNGFRSLQMTGIPAGTEASIFVDSGAELTLVGCTFEPITSPGVQFNWIIQGGSTVYEINPGLSPSGGNTFIGYGGGSTQYIMSGTTQTRKNSTNSLVAGYIPPTASAAAYFDSDGALTSNSAPIRSNSGSIAATTIPQTIFTLTTGGSYYLYAAVNNSGTDYRTVVLITTDGVTADITNLKAGVQMLITLSGLNIQLALGVGAGGAGWGLIRVV